jgi:hypothetical protein
MVQIFWAAPILQVGHCMGRNTATPGPVDLPYLGRRANKVFL